MNTYIKICGLSTPAAVAAAVEAGANAVGFVFAPSPRRVSLTQAVSLLQPVRHCIDSVAVMHHPDPQDVQVILEALNPKFLQTDFDDFEGLNVINEVTCLPVFRSNTSTSMFWNQLQCTNQDPILFEGGQSGSGVMADWNLAAQVARKRRIILAGGLDENNVAKAMELVRPWGVDVSSGVESDPGIKDPDKVARFIRVVREHTDVGDRSQ